MFYAYVIQSVADPSQYYRGHTSDLKSRLAAHNAGKSSHASKLTPWCLRFYAGFDSLEQARHFGQYLKTGSGHAFAKRHLGL